MHAYDPDAISPTGWYHVFIFALVLPWLSVRSKKRLAGAKAMPPRRKHYTSAIVTLLVLFGFSLWVASIEWIELFPRFSPSWTDVAWGALMLAVTVAGMLPRWRKNVERRAPIVQLFMPRNRLERVLWLAVSVSAAVGEEVSYRGVLYTLLMRIVHQPLLAVAIASIAFGVAHWVQGWKSAVVIVFFAGAFHLLVYATGSLYVAMAVHFLYDATAGLAYGYFGKKLGYPIEGVAQTATPAA